MRKMVVGFVALVLVASFPVTLRWLLAATQGGGQFHPPDAAPGFALTKQGQALGLGSAGTWDSGNLDSATVFWDSQTSQFVMVYVGYNTVEQLGYATRASLSSGSWTKYAGNPTFAPSGVGGAPDQNGVTGPFVHYDGTTYFLFYIGLTGTGFEGGTPSICLATSTDWIPGSNAGTWSRQGAIISPSGSGWRSTKIWHPNVVQRGSTYYLFFNANGAHEEIGYATSSDLLSWTVDDANSPVVIRSASGWDSNVVGDPYVYRLRGYWYMAYYASGADGKGRDGMAYTTEALFPLGWTKYAANPTLDLGGVGAFDEAFAAKPAIWIDGGIYYHWYAGAVPSHNVQGIGLATEDASGYELSGVFPLQ